MSTALSVLAPLASGLRYFNCVAQRAAILRRLENGPATRLQIEAECSVPDATARIHELRHEGHQIARQWVDQPNPDRTVNRVALYVLLSRDGRQFSLDLQ